MSVIMPHTTPNPASCFWVWEATADGLTALIPTTHMGDLRHSWGLAWAWLHLGCCSYLESGWKADLCQSLTLSYSAFHINK